MLSGNPGGCICFALPVSTDSHRVHGLAGEEVAPDWPALESAELRSVLAEFADLRGPMTILWHSPRPLSAAARVRTPAGEVFIKRHCVLVRTRENLAEEHAFIAHLRKRGIPVPQVLANDAGETAIARGPWTYEVHALAAGLDLYRDSFSWSPLTELGHALSAGRMLARLHLASADYHAPQRSTTILVSRDDILRAPDFVTAVAEQAALRPALGSFLGARAWRTELAALAKRQQRVQPRIVNLPRLWTHNDWHASNLGWTGKASTAQVASVFDFGLSSPTFALYDLATAIERNAVAWLELERGMGAIYPDTVRALIEGYAEVLPLGPETRRLLADLLPVVHADFALSEVEYYQGITHSVTNADIAWSTFLLGHAAWFDTPPGVVLLQAIAEPA